VELFVGDGGVGGGVDSGEEVMKVEW